MSWLITMSHAFAKALLTLRRNASDLKFKAHAVADPGFPRGGEANPEGGGANLLFGQFSPKTA